MHDAAHIPAVPRAERKLMIDVNTLPALFLAMEERERLFDLRLPDGTYYWDLVRVDVYAGLYHAYVGTFEDPASMARAAPSLLKNFVKRSVNAVMRQRIARRRPTYLFCRTRKAKHDGKFVDIVADPVLELVQHESVAVDLGNVGAGSVRSLFASSDAELPPPLLYGSALLSRSHQVVREIGEVLSRTFDRSIDLPRLLTEPLAMYFQYRRHVSQLFARHAPRSVVVNNNGQLKGVFAAARAHGVPTLELQHGSTSPDIPFWSYPWSIPSNHPGLTLPTAFLTFADYWNTNTNYPVRHTLTIGNRHLFQPRVPNGTGNVVVISAYMYQQELGGVTRSLAATFPERIFFFKLHPHQFKSLEQIRAEFAAQPNVRVIADDLSLTQLFAESDFVIGVHSTALYSALQATKNVMIYRRAGYAFPKDISDYCELFASADEAASIIAHAETRFREKTRAPVFFAPFDAEACRHALDNLRDS